MRRLLEAKLNVLHNDIIYSIDPQSIVTNKQLTIFGGLNEMDDVVNTCIQFNFESQKIQIKKNNNYQNLTVGQCVWQLDDRTILFGGRKRDKFTNNLQILNINTYDIKLINTNQDKSLRVPNPRELARSLLISNDLILVIGGNNTQVLQDIYLLDVPSYKWKYIGELSQLNSNIPYAKFSLSLANDKIYLFGGLRKVGKYCEISKDIYSISKDNINKPKFTLQQPKYGKMIPLADHMSIVVDDRYIMMIGGQTVRNNYSKTYDIKPNPNTDIWCYDTSISQCFKLITNVSPRFRGGAVIKNCQIFIFGGLTNYQTFNPTIEILQLANFKFDSMCTICKSIYQLPILFDCPEDSINTSFPQHPYQQIRTMNIDLINKFIQSSSLSSQEAVGLLVNELSKNNGLNIFLPKNQQQNQSGSSINCAIEFYEVQHTQVPNNDKYFLQTILIGSLKLGYSFIFITYQQNKKLITFVDTLTNKKFFFIQFKQHYKWDNQFQKQQIVNSFGYPITWNEICSFKKHDNFNQKNINAKLIVYNLRKDILQTGSQLSNCNPNESYNDMKITITQYLNKLYLFDGPKINLQQQRLLVQTPNNLQEIKVKSDLIQSIFASKASERYPEQIIQIYQKCRLIYTLSLPQSIYQKLKTNNYGLIIVLLKFDIKLNIFKNNVEDGEKQFKDEIIRILLEQSERIGDKRINQFEIGEIQQRRKQE